MIRYYFIFLVSFIGTKLFGLEGTILKFKSLGIGLKRVLKFHDTADVIALRVEKAMHTVPLNIKCLDQAIVTWFALNLHNHPAVLRIGMSITPLESHAWVVVRNQVFVSAINIEDLHIVAEYEAW